MAKTREEIIQILEEDKKRFQGFLDEISKHKVKMLKPKTLNEVVGAASIVAYINSRLPEL